MVKRSLFLLLFYVSFAFASINANQTQLPLTFDVGNPAPYGGAATTIIIQGKKIPIMFDTGAWKTEITLSPTILKTLQVTYTGKSVCFHGTDGRHCEKAFIVPEIKLGNFVIKQVRGTVMPELWGKVYGQQPMMTAAMRDGVIGLALLSKFNVMLDYPHAKAILVKPKHNISGYDITKWTAIPFEKNTLTQLKLNGKLMMMVWDTGAIPSTIKQTSVKDFAKTNCPKNTPYDTKACTRIITTSLTTIKNRPLANTWFAVEDIPANAPFDGLIGTNFYAANQTYFDFDNHVIYVSTPQ